MSRSMKDIGYKFFMTLALASYVFLASQSAIAQDISGTFSRLGPGMDVHHPGLPGTRDYWAGVIYFNLNIFGAIIEVPTYCIDIERLLDMDATYNKRFDDLDPRVLYILTNYYPFNPIEPSGLAENERKAAAVQLAIWSFTNSDSVDIAPEDPGETAYVFETAREIIAEANSYPNFEANNLTLAPSFEINPVGTDHKMTARLTYDGTPVQGETITFKVTGANAKPATQYQTNSTGYAFFEYTGNNLGTDTISATTTNVLQVGLILEADVNDQPVALAYGLPLNKTVIKSWEGLCLGGNKTNDTGVGLSGWTIEIYRNDSGTLTFIDDNVTNSNGEWRVCDLLTGVYDVKEILHDATWKPLNPAGGWHRGIALDHAEVKLDIDFVNSNKSCLGGNKTNDTGVRLPGWTIEVYINGTSTKVGENVTNPNGEWRVCNLLPGTYDVKEILDPGWEPLDPADGWHRAVVLGGNETRLGIDFKNNYTTVYCIEGHKYEHPSLKPLSGWNITATDSSGQEVGNATTDDNGYWQICGLTPGEVYTFCEVLKAGWNAIDPPDGCYNNVTFEPGQTSPLDFYNDPRNITVTKVADKYEVKSGEEVTYTITVCNHGGTDVHNVTVWDVFNRHDVEILSMSPALGPDGKWHFDVIPVGECRTITIKIRVPERQDFEFGMEQGVSGEGFVNVANDYSTTFEEYLIENCVYVTSDWNADPISACATVVVGEELGTRLETREYGSGLFDVEEKVTIFTENKSIEWEEDLSASYRPTTIGLYNNRTVNYDSAWVKKARAKNYVTGTTMTETYHDAAWLDRESRMFLDENESVMEVNSEFDGRGHVGFLKMPSDSTPQTTPLFEAREDYTGSFKVVERIDEYGSAVSSEKAASGEGLVVVDKRVGDSQRSYESGTGAYDSEELIKTNNNYIAKDISLVHAPTSQRLTDDVSIDASMKWKEGMYSKVENTSYIGEEYTSITELDKETVALGLNEMDTDADFSGRGRYRAILKDEVDFDEEYNGDYSVERRVVFTGIAKYDRPHLNVTKTLVGGIVEEILPWGYGEEHLEGEIKKRKVATYNIRIENDGNRALIPVHVKDIFPPGAKYINASKRPSELTETYANWTLTHLSIGDIEIITLNLDVTKYHPSELVNRVEVCGGYDEEAEWICASNFSALEINWLTCCPSGPLSVKKTAELDETNSSVVRYKVEIRNWEDATKVATVTDRLPAGMKLIDSSIPFATYDGNVVVWNIFEIGPSETATIEFSALAPGDGRFTNTVEVDPRSVDGPVVQPISATCVIDVGVVEDECGPVSCGIWQPPNWELEHYGYEPDQLTCEELTCTGGD